MDERERWNKMMDSEQMRAARRAVIDAADRLNTFAREALAEMDREQEWALEQDRKEDAFLAGPVGLIRFALGMRFKRVPFPGRRRFS